MNTLLAQEALIAGDVEKLRAQFPITRELYREVCGLLFFRYGIQPTANKLYQLVRKGTMSTPSEALNQFWVELREKSRIQIDHPGLPENLKTVAGELINTLWSTAQDSAEANFNVMRKELHERMAASTSELELANDNFQKITEVNIQLLDELKAVKNLLSETENKLVVDTQISNNLKESLKSLQNEKLVLEAALGDVRANFSKEVDKLHSSLQLSEQRYRSLESKTLLDVDRERVRSSKCLDEIAQLKKELKYEQATSTNMLVKHQKSVSGLKENIALMKGQLKESQRQSLLSANKLKQLEMKLATRVK